MCFVCYVPMQCSACEVAQMTDAIRKVLRKALQSLELPTQTDPNSPDAHRRRADEHVVWGLVGDVSHARVFRALKALNVRNALKTLTLNLQAIAHD